MNNTIKIPIIKVEQPIGVVYITKMSSSDLLRMSSVDRRHIDEDDEIIGIQRPLKQDKIRKIKKYLTTQNATFPNSIIVNIRKEDVVNITNCEIEIKDHEKTFTIIDGQHRLYGFEGYNGEKFELILAIFIGLEFSLQSEVFSIINSEQTKVNPSLNINIELSNKKETPIKKIVQIAQAFNIDKNSPWYHQIKMLGVQNDGIISLAAFAKPLINLTYPENKQIDIENKLSSSFPSFPEFNDICVDTKKYPFWSFYISQETSIIYKILFNFFSALKKILNNDWMNPDSILNKTSGYNAVINLLKIIIPIGLSKGDLTESFFLEILRPIEKMSGSISSEIYGSSGFYSSNKLCNDMIKELNLNDFEGNL